MSFRAIHQDYPLILASASPRRKRLLAQLGIPFRSRASRISEALVDTVPEAAVRLIAERKAVEIYRRSAACWILGADTVVVVNGEVLGKPRNADDSRIALHKLSGRVHQVMTGFCVLAPSGDRVHSDSVTTDVWVKNLSPAEIEAYIGTGEPFGKAGSYAIQGIGAFLVEGLSGSYTNVVGLPLCEVVKALMAVGALNAFPLPPAVERSPKE